MDQYRMVPPSYKLIYNPHEYQPLIRKLNAFQWGPHPVPIHTMFVCAILIFTMGTRFQAM